MRLPVCILLVSLSPIPIGAAPDSETPPPPLSDGCVLNVDFEHYLDGAVGLLNAGIRNLGYPFSDIEKGKIEVSNDPEMAYEGNRCAYVFTDKPSQRGPIFLQRRFDAPEISDEVVEFLFRPVSEEAVKLEEFTVWSASSYKGGRAGITLLANGDPASGTYSVDIESDGDLQKGVIAGLFQNEWVRFVLSRDRKDKSVGLWAGPPGAERWIGRYADYGPGRSIGRARIGDPHEGKTIGSGYWDNIRVGKARGPDDPLATAEATRNVGTELPNIVYPIEVGAEKQLFVDDVVIESMEGLTRSFHQVQKHPDNPLVVPEEPWEVDGTWYVPYETAREAPGEKLRIWYGAYRRSKNKLTYTCVVESEDGLHWERPNYGLFEFEGSKENNIVWEGRIIRTMYDPHDPDPSRRYKGMMRSAGFTPGFSPDGVHWTLAKEPAIEQAYDATVFSWDPIGEKWLACVKMFQDGKRMRGYAESKDFVNWSDTYPMLRNDKKDHPEDQLYAMRIVRYESVYIGLLKVFHVHTDRCDIQLAFSRNGKHWERLYREPFLTNSLEEGAYDYGNLDDAGAPIRMGDELWFYYGARSNPHYERPTDTNGSIALATLRVDGFVSMDAGEDDGTLVTKPLILSGDSLYLNVDAEGGAIHVEILDEQGDNAIARSESITSDGVHQEVVWKGVSLAAIEDRPVRLRFIQRDAKLYSFWSQ